MKWVPKSKELIPRLEKEDSELYKEFYGKLISRDSAIEIILQRFNDKDREAIYNKTASISDVLIKGYIPEKDYLLSPEELQYIYNLNNDLKLTASRCFHSFRWGTYNVSPTDITTSPELYHLSDKAKLTIIGTVVAFIIGLIVFIFESS